MISLQQIQHNLIASIEDPEDKHLDAYLIPTSYDGMEIYRNNILQRLIKTLMLTYPMVLRLVGKDFFRVMARQYVLQHPCTMRNLNDYGAEFASFIADFSPAKSLTYLPEMAQLEWAYQTVYLAPSCDPFPIDQLAQIEQATYPEICFKLNPACRILDFQYPVLQIWEACLAPDSDESITLKEQGDRVLIIRWDLEIAFIRLNLAEFVFLGKLNQGLNFAQACDQALATDPEFDIVINLQNWIKTAVIVDFT